MQKVSLVLLPNSLLFGLQQTVFRPLPPAAAAAALALMLCTATKLLANVELVEAKRTMDLWQLTRASFSTSIPTLADPAAGEFVR